MLVGSLSRGGLPPGSVLAAMPPAAVVPPGLSLAEIKITGNEFVMLQNSTGASIPDLSKYWLYVFNNVNPLSVGVSSSSQQLPAGSLQSGQTVLLSANGGSTCGAAITGKLNLSLNDSGGFLEVVQTDFSGGSLTQTAGDSLSWSSGANSTAGMIGNVPSNTTAPNGAYYRFQNTSGSGAPYLWQQANLDVTVACQLNVTISGVTTAGPSVIGSQLLPGSLPPATIVSLSDDSLASTTGALPPSDVGLAAPQVNELMPNPAEPQTDSEDEFVELYNSNDVAFDLSGFKLQTGTTSLHTYNFPSDTSLAPKNFTVYYSIDTNLSLSNSGGQVRLLDPAGNIISQADVYGSAPDGQSWALANGTWYWTMTPTTGSANIINQPLTVKSLTTGSVATGSSAAKKTTSSSTKAAATPKVKAATTTAGANSATPAKNSSPLHPLVLAGVGVGAVAYAAYEYRNDLQNRFYQLRRYRAARTTAGTSSKEP